MTTHLWPAISRYSFFFIEMHPRSQKNQILKIFEQIVRFDALYILALWEQFHSSGSSCYPASEVCSAI